ncbi:MAG TPA: MIP family channel protein [archaeon]|nr:MIP family channel protein [archaeon]
MHALNQKYVAEFLGTFALVFIGAGSVLVNSISGGAVGLVGVALAHGLVLMSMIYALGAVSGGHFNPAVSIAVWAAKKMPAKTTGAYVVSQLLGAAVAGFLLASIFPIAPAAAHLGVTDLQGITLGKGIVLEAVLTFFLVLAVFGVALDPRGSPHHAGLAVGLVLAFGNLVGGPLTGAAMNPARAFGPALASGYWATQLVYWIGPIAGALVAAMLYQYVFWRAPKAVGAAKKKKK